MLTGEWVVVSPHRTERPWQGQVEKPDRVAQPEYDPDCYLCPRNSRAGGAKNPDYQKTFVFTNDYSALYPLPADLEITTACPDLLVASPEPGICKVMCFSPRHDLTLATMAIPEIRGVIDTWAEQRSELATEDWIHYVQIFENRGTMMGASNPHPHCQIWANANIPNEPSKELRAQSRYLESHGKCLLCEYLSVESQDESRLVWQNSAFLIVVPFWAVWPFEVLVIAKRHTADLVLLDSSERDQLAQALQALTSAFDLLFETPFPYSMGFHERPSDGEEHPEWHLHAHFYPPLLRSATIRKFMVGYELLGGPQRDITPEAAAARLRDLFRL